MFSRAAYFHLLSASIRTSIRPILRASLILFFVIGFLYGLHYAPHINYYYFVEPLEKLQFTKYYTLVVDSRVFDNPASREEFVESTVSCLNEIDDYVVLGGELEVYIQSLGRSSLPIYIASSPRALQLVFADIDIEELEARLESIDGIYVDIPDVLGYRLPSRLVGEVVTATISADPYSSSTTARLLTVRSRSIFGTGFVVVLIGSKYLDLVSRTMLGTLVVGTEDTSSLEKCLESVLTRFREKYAGLWPPPRFELYNVSREIAYRQSYSNVYSRQIQAMLELFSVLAVVIAFIVSFREGIAYAESSSELIGILRLYGAPRRLLFLLGFASGLLVLISVVAGMLIVPYLYYKGLFGGSMPPLLFLLSRTWSFIVLVLPACPLASGLGSLWYTSRRSLESFVSSH